MKSVGRKLGALVVAVGLLGSASLFAEGFFPPPPPPGIGIGVGVGVGVGMPQFPPSPVPYGGGYGYGGFPGGDHGFPGAGGGFNEFERHRRWERRRARFMGRGECGAPWRHHHGGCGFGRRSFRSFSLNIGLGGGGFGFGLNIGHGIF